MCSGRNWKRRRALHPIPSCASSPLAHLLQLMKNLSKSFLLQFIRREEWLPKLRYLFSASFSDHVEFKLG
jgi:hypothetical protein